MGRKGAGPIKPCAGDCRRALFAVPVVLLACSLLPRGLAPGLRADVNIPGNCNGNDERVNLTDAIFLLEFLFHGGPAPPCLLRCDFTQDRSLDISDAISLIQYAVLGNPVPSPLVIPPEVCGDGIDNNCDGEVDEGCQPDQGFQVDLAWEPVTRDILGNPKQVAGYRVFWGTASAVFPNRLDTLCTCATLTGLKSGLTYYAAVLAFDAVGVEGPLSAEIHFIHP